MPVLTLSGIVAAILALFVAVRWWQNGNNPKGLPFPPGPQSRLLVGNLRDLPKNGNEWVEYENLSKTYGDIIYFNVLGNSILSVNSYQAANDLLNKKGAIYSDRPRLPMVKELMGWDWNLILKSYSEGFATYRRIVQQKFQAQVVVTHYRPVMLREARVLLQNILAKPDNFAGHLRSMAGAVIMMVTYGHQTAPENDEFVKLAEDVREHSSGTHGSSLVDTLPILKYVPSWLPGAAFKRNANISKQLSAKMRNAPFEMVKKQLSAGTARPSIISSLLEEKFSTDGLDSEEIIKNCGGVVYSAGADTTVAALTNFFLAMMTYPHVQDRAQKELDLVVGRDRLPQFEDLSDLAYTSALVKETLRWKAVSPLGVPHYTAESDEYRNTFIPKGTVVMANISAMLHDERVYAEPQHFNPERFLPTSTNAGAPDPANTAFGFGRRICPGRFFAEDSLWIAITSILHVFRISKSQDAQGRDIIPDVQWGSGLVSMPSPFTCEINPRFEGAAALISSTIVD